MLTLPGGSLFSSPSPPPVAPAPVPTKNDEEIKEKAKAKADAERRRRGFGNTILTQPGLGDVAAPVQRSGLLGRVSQ